MTQVPLKPQADEVVSQPTPLPVQSPPELPASVNGSPTVDSLLYQVPSHRGRSLRRQLLMMILPLTLIPLVAEGAISYISTQNEHETRLKQELEGKVLLVNQGVKHTLKGVFTTTETLARNPILLNLVRSGSRKAEAENLMLSRRTVNDIEGQLGATKLLAPNQAFNNYLADVSKAEEFAELIVTEKNGLNVGYSAPSSDAVQIDEDWWQQGKAQIQWVSNPTYDASGGFGINLSQAIQDPDKGNFLGVLKVFISASDFGDLSELLKYAGIQGSQEVQLLDVSLGSALVSYTAAGKQTPKDLVDRLTINGGSVVSQLALRVVEAEQAQQKPAIATLQQDLQKAFPVQDLRVSRVGETGTEQTLLVSFAYGGKQYALSTLSGLDWVAIASMDVAEIGAAGQKTLYTFITLALILGAVTSLITVGLSRQLSAPLKDLSIKAQQVSAGNLDVAAEPKGSLEAQTLAQTFNTLVGRVKGFLREQVLNTRRASLTAEITGAKTTSSAETLPVFDRVVEEARDILKCDRIVIYQFNSDWSGAIVAESVAIDYPSAFLQQLDDPCIPATTRQKYLEDGLLLINDVNFANLHPDHLVLLKRLSVQSILSVPIISQGQLYGLLIAHHCKTSHHWQTSESDFLKQLGLQLGLVIERVKLLEQTRSLAEEQRQIKEGLQRNALQLLMDVDPVSQGNLTVRAKVTEDEIGTVADSYNATIANLRKIVLKVQGAATQVAETTDTSETSIRSLADAATQQTAEILVALERAQEMADSVQLVAANAEKAEIAVQQATQTVQAGDEAMNRTVDGILAIRSTVAETAKKVKRLGESSQKISNVVNLISGFAAQTNMLALNAAIEASRAGESGKGFAVVAEEVRELARQSAEATTEIEKLVASIQTETNEVVTAMEDGTRQVVEGTRQVDETRQSLNQITATSRQISALVESIAQATLVQSKASETVTDAMTNVVAIANQNSTAANQVASSFEELRSVAQALQEEVGRFKVS